MKRREQIYQKYVELGEFFDYIILFGLKYRLPVKFEQKFEKNKNFQNFWIFFFLIKLKNALIMWFFAHEKSLISTHCVIIYELQLINQTLSSQKGYHFMWTNWFYFYSTLFLVIKCLWMVKKHFFGKHSFYF